MTLVLVTGTDSAVGKTWVARGLAHALTAAGRRVLAVKPVETGCATTTRSEEDGALLAAATGQADPAEALIRFDEPLAPAFAAEREEDQVDLDALLLRIEPLAATTDVLLLEGIGGLLNPITWEWNIVDLVRSLGGTAVVVGVDRQGSINHMLLALSALELAGVEVRAAVLTAPEAPDRSTGSNAGAIARLSGLERVLALPRAADPRSAAHALAPVVEWVLRPGPDEPEP